MRSINPRRPSDIAASRAARNVCAAGSSAPLAVSSRARSKAMIASSGRPPMRLASPSAASSRRSASSPRPRAAAIMPRNRSAGPKQTRNCSVCGTKGAWPAAALRSDPSQGAESGPLWFTSFAESRSFDVERDLLVTQLNGEHWIDAVAGAPRPPTSVTCTPGTSRNTCAVVLPGCTKRSPATTLPATPRVRGGAEGCGRSPSLVTSTTVGAPGRSPSATATRHGTKIEPKK